MIVRGNTAYRILRKLKKAKKQNPQKKKKTQNPPHQCDKCGHCCGIMNSPQHPGLPPHGAGDLQPLVLTVPLLLLSNTIDVHISPFLFFQIQLKLENTPNQMMRWWKTHKGLKKHKRGEGTRVRLKKCIKPDDKVLSKAEMIRAGRRCAITGITTSGLPSLLFIAPAFTPPGTSTAAAYHTITHLHLGVHKMFQSVVNVHKRTQTAYTPPDTSLAA